MPSADPDQTLDHLFEMELAVTDAEIASGTGLRLAGLMADHRIAGFFSLTQISRGAFQNAYAAWRVSADQIGRGLATEGVLGMLDLAFADHAPGVGLHRVQASIIPRAAQDCPRARRIGWSARAWCMSQRTKGGRVSMSEWNTADGPERPGFDRRTWMPTLAGVLEICAGITSLIGAAILGLIGSAALTIPDNIAESVPDWPFSLGVGLFGGLFSMLFALGALGVIGGTHALRRSSWIWAIIGAIAATLSCFPLGIAAIVLTVMSENELSPRKT
jgi:hypothetical protein